MKSINQNEFIRGGVFALLAVCVLMPLTALAQTGGSYELTWSTIDGGGGISSGGDFVLSGTIGQPDAGWMSGGDYELLGGFRPGGPTWCWDYLTQCHGDADGDGWVKDSDFLALKESWYKCYPELAYNLCADFDRDGCVKASDFLILKSNWYEAVDPNCPQGDINGIYW